MVGKPYLLVDNQHKAGGVGFICHVIGGLGFINVFNHTLYLSGFLVGAVKHRW